MGRSRLTGRRDVVDDDALRLLWDEHAAPLLAYCTRLTNGDRMRAEDLVQETLLRAWQHPDAMDPLRGPTRPWLLTVARRLAVDQHRARTARPPEVAPVDVADDAMDDVLDRALDSWLVSDAMATLSPAHREALQATYYAGRRAAEAAAVMGVPEGTVRSRVYYALRALRVALEERGVTS
jgi:RNA polymerase sigma-70 factor (ECF subfamily)